MAANPAFTSTPRIGAVNVASAVTDRAAGGTVTTLLTGVAAGTKVFEIDVKCAATSAAATVFLYLSADSGSTWKLFDEITVNASTGSATVPSFSVSKTYNNLVLNGTASVLGCSTTISQSTNVFALAADLT